MVLYQGSNDFWMYLLSRDRLVEITQDWAHKSFHDDALYVLRLGTDIVFGALEISVLHVF